MKNQMLKAAVAAAVTATVARDDVPASNGAIAPIVDAVIKEAAPMVEHANNAEPWFQSNVTWGAVVTIVASIGTLAGLVQAGVTDGQAYATAAGALIGAGWTLYGRWVAKKPIGR